MLSLSLIAFGIAAAAWATSVRVDSAATYLLVPGLWLGGGALIGAGIGILLPFKIPSIGLIIGAILGVAAQLFIFLLLSH
jgi:hypothetical protein